MPRRRNRRRPRKKNPSGTAVAVAAGVGVVGFLVYSKMTAKKAVAAPAPGPYQLPAYRDSAIAAPVNVLVNAGTAVVDTFKGFFSVFTGGGSSSSGSLEEAYCTPDHPYQGCTPTRGVAKATTAESLAIFKAHQARLGVKQDGLLGPKTVTAHNKKYVSDPSVGGVTSVDLLARLLLQRRPAALAGLAGLGDFGGTLASRRYGSLG